MSPLIAWLAAHWWWVLIALVLLVAMVLLLVPMWRRWRFRRRMLREQERLRDDLLLRKELAEVARGRVSPEEKVLKARVEDLRAAFDDGLRKLEASGRGRYGLPWVLVVGEPGAGKTAALRHSGLSFPADLVDPHQGEAGTESMHWWIGENGAFLDLAGSILFARWGNQGNAEWRNLLGLLGRRRKRCPLDALVVCIPADSLLADGEEISRRKAALLAEELGRLHRTLGLLLPTWVLVTKADRVLGFSHAVRTLEGPARAAPAGWVNPAADGTYDRAALLGWFTQAEERLERARAAALTEDAWWEDASGHRSARMDEYLPFAGQVHALSTTLDLYLSAVFTGSAWSSGGRSLLMGVSFSSAVDEGRPLDPEAAAARGGQDPEAIVAAAGAPAERPCFLNGFFADRALPSTRQVGFSPARARAARRPWLVAAGLLALLAVAGGIGTALGLGTLSERIAPQERQWRWLEQTGMTGSLRNAALVRSSATSAEVVSDETLPQNASTRRVDLLASTWESSERHLAVPFWLRLTSVGDGTFAGDLFAEERHGAFRLLLSALLTRPLVDTVRNRLSDERLAWTPEVHAALVQLLQIELGGGPDAPAIDLGALGRFAVSGNPHEQADLEVLLASQPVAGTRPDPAAPGWDLDLRNPASRLAAALGGGTTASGRPLQQGVKAFCREWTGDAPHRATRLARVAALVRAMERYAAAEDALFAVGSTLAGHAQNDLTVAQAESDAGRWLEAWRALDDAARTLSEAAHAADHQSGIKVEDLAADAGRDYQTQLDGEFAALLDPIARCRTKGRPLTSYAAAVEQQLRDARESARRSAARGAERAASTAASLAAVFADGSRPWGAHERRLALLAPVAAELGRAVVAIPLAQADEELRRLAARAADLAARAAPLKSDKDQPVEPRAQSVADTARAGLDVHVRRRASGILIAALKEAGDSPDAVADAVGRLAAGRPALPRPEVPLVSSEAGGSFSPRHHPGAASDHLSAVAATVRWTLTDGQGGERVTAPIPLADAAELGRMAQDRRQAAAAYERAYVAYWTDTVRDQSLPAPFPDWASFSASAATLNVVQVINALRLTGDQVHRALGIVLRDEEASRRAQAARLAIEDERTGFSGALGLACRTEASAWKNLPSDAAAARQGLLGQPAETLKQGLFAAWDDRRTGLACWWNAYTLRALSALRNDAVVRAQKDREALLGSYHRFPLVAGTADATALTMDQVRQAAALLANLVPADPPAGGPPAAAGPVAPPDELTSTLASLRDPLTAAGFAADTARFRAMSVVARALSDDTVPTTWIPVAPGPEVFRSPAPGIGRIPAVLGVRYLALRVDPQRPPVRMQASGDPGGLPARCDGIPVAAGDIDVLLYRHADEDAPVGKIPLGGPWLAVRLLLDRNTRRDADGTCWAPLSTGGAEPAVLWLGLRFNRAMPAAAAWPQPLPAR